MGQVKFDWDKIRYDYVTGGETYRELAKRYGVCRTTLQTHGVNEGWVEQREAYRAKIRADVQDKMADLAKDGMETGTRIAVKLLRRLEARVDDEEIPITAQDFRAYSSAIQDIMVILANGGRRAERLEVVISGELSDYAG